MPTFGRHINQELWRVAAGAMIFIAIALVYGRAIHAPLLFDDHANIEANPTIRSFAE